MSIPIPEDELEKIRGQYNHGPYPRHPIEQSPKDNYESLYLHSLVTCFYLRDRQVIDTQGKTILDAGCGSGYKSLLLAEANPGAKIVGIDLSEASVKLAQQRLNFHGFEQAEFHVFSLYDDLTQLGLEYDYINCDEVLYLVPDPIAALTSLKSVLKPTGLIRANLHSLYQRTNFFRAQEVFKLMGLFDQAPSEFEETAVHETMTALKDQVLLKAQTWQGQFIDPQISAEAMSELLNMNYLLMGDKGFTIPDLFALLEEAEMEFLSMLNWRQWDVLELFKEAENPPALLGIGLANASIPEKLGLYELLNPVHRLIDFWCGHPVAHGISVDEWSEADWQRAIVHLHPQLRVETVREELIQCVRTGQAFGISRYIPVPAMGLVMLEPNLAACFLPLWEGPLSIHALVDRYRQARPLDWVTLEPISQSKAFETIKEMLNRMDAFLYVLLEQPH